MQILHEPIGVEGQKILWNVPFLKFTWKHGFALASENFIALKTTTQTPLTSLSLAKTVNVAQVFFLLNVKDDIKKLNAGLNIASKMMWERTNKNLHDVRIVFNVERLMLISDVGVMLLASIVGLFLSILVHQHALHIFITNDWLLVATCTHAPVKDNSWAN